MTTPLLVSAISLKAVSLATHALDQLLCRPQAKADMRFGWVPQLSPAYADSGQAPLLGFTRMLHSAAQQSGRSQLGLEMAAFEGSATYSIFGELFEWAPTLRDALGALTRYFPVSQTDTSIRLTESNGQAHLTYQINDPAVGDRLHDSAYTLGKLCRSIRRSAGAGWRPEQVLLAAPAPRVQDPYRGYFRAPVAFDAPLSGLHFSAHMLDRPIATADPRRYQQSCAQLACQMPQAPDPGLLCQALHTWLGYAAREGCATLEQAAADFGVTPRTLQRRLKERGIGFQDLLAKVRMENAQRLLTESGLPVTAIAQELGFSETSAFTRAFRQHTQMSPRAFRQAARAAA